MSYTSDYTGAEIDGGILKTTFITVTGNIDLDDVMTKTVYDPNSTAGDVFDSANIDYDGTTSGLAATNVQDAIDEVDSDLDAHKADNVSSGNPHGIDAKANKEQEDWITPTLLNGHEEDEDYPIGYMKDEFGIVHLKGTLTNISTGTNAFQLPSGYRPPQESRLVGYTGNSTTQGRMLISNFGNLLVVSYAAYISLDGISFTTF